MANYKEGDILTNDKGEQVILSNNQWVTYQPPQQPEELSFGDKSLGAARSFLEGQTFGFADEAGLGLASLAGSATTGESIPDVYKKMRQQYNLEQGEFERQHPKTALASTFTGGLLTGGTGASKALATPIARANPVKAATLLGAGSGMVAGAGHAPTMEDVPSSMAVGAGFGAVLPPSLMLGGKLTSPVVSAIKRGLTLQSPETTAAKAVSKFLKSDSISARELARKSRVPETTLADIGGENVKGAAVAAGVLPGKGKDAAKNMFVDRQKGSFKRLMGSLKKLAGGDTNYFQNVRNIVKTRSEQASPLYKEAFSTGRVDPQKVTALIDDISDIASSAQGTKIGTQIKSVISALTKKDAVKGKRIPKLDLKELHWAKMDLDDRIDSAFRSGNKTLGTQLRDIKTQLLEIMDDVPQYAEARGIYSSNSSVMGAMEKGRSVLRDDFDGLAFDVVNMSKAEKEGFINGALKTIRDKLMTGREDKNAATKLATQLTRERLRNVFPDDESYKTFINQLDIEDDFARTYQAVYGGSQTQPRQIGHKGLVSAVKGDNIIEGGDTLTAVRGVIKKVTGRDEIPQPVVDEIQRILFTPIKDLTAKDKFLLKKHGVSTEQAGKMHKLLKTKGLIPSAAGFATVEAGLSRSE